MQSDPGEGGSCSLFALVTYVPDPLGSFLDALRQELVPACNLRAHVTVLPPRRLAIPVEAAWDRIRSDAVAYPAFEIAINDVEIFSISSVVYLGLAAGRQELVRLHDLLNTNGLHTVEAYPYHPHITLAQNMAPEQVAGVFALARRRWAEYRDARSFPADRVTFVRGETLDCWRDLRECELAPAQPRPTGPLD
jgi:2'-5' RNA ligase